MKAFNEPVWPLSIGGGLIIWGVPAPYVLYAIIVWGVVCTALAVWHDHRNHRA